MTEEDITLTRRRSSLATVVIEQLIVANPKGRVKVKVVVRGMRKRTTDTEPETKARMKTQTKIDNTGAGNEFQWAQYTSSGLLYIVELSERAGDLVFVYDLGGVSPKNTIRCTFSFIHGNARRSCIIFYSMLLYQVQL